jgi:hypothetical protein
MNDRDILRLGRAACAALVLAAAAGCGDIKVQAEPKLPPALVSQLPLTVGVYYGNNFRTYKHREERWGSGYEVDLGPGHVHFAEQLFRIEFTGTVPVESLDAVPQNAHLAAVVEPRIERYSFLTARDTGGQYFAVTIDYRLNLFNTKGERIDSFTFVGYGSAPSKGMSSTSPLEEATQSAMRDAAAKFLVQFPAQGTVKKLLAGEPVAPLGESSVASTGAEEALDGIEMVPIVEKPVPQQPDLL